MAGKIVISELEPDSTYDSGITLSANTTSDALRITQTGTGNALVVEDSASPDSTPFVIDASGRVGIGLTNPENVLHVVGQGFFDRTGTTSASQPQQINQRRKRDANAVLVSGDDISVLTSWGWDGAAYIKATEILSEVDGTPGTNDMPGRLVFSTTADGASSVTERMRLTSDGYLRMASGTGGIQFGGDTAAANALDDYEEGTFTPAFQNIGTGTYGTRQGAYTKIGNVVTIQLTVAMVTLGTANGQLVVTGLPFVPKSGLNQSTNRIWTNSWAADAQNVIGLFGGSTTIDFYKTAVSGVSASAVHSDIGATGNIVVSCSYLV